MAWIVVETKSLQERLTLRDLDRHAFESFMPEREYEIPHRHHVEVRRGPLYPRYLFANVDLSVRAWTKIFSMRGVRNILGSPSVVSDDVIRLIGYVALRDVLSPGERVMIKSWGVEALFSECVDDRYRCLFQFMGKEVHLDLSRMEIDRMAA